ncbi:helix-turn-helix transcriptional regulator [Microbulbifer halophilus]|uniref:Helix-turn-helix transcriptional regulator n=1 Tax=Microbulbifer halophilus TaxID=453963 RepID=A0ABW5E6E2_9GAMM
MPRKHDPGCGDGDSLFDRLDRTRLQRARTFIEAQAGAPLSVDIIAREAGISASGLQRLFRRTEGVSVFGYLRRVRLERALAALQGDGVTVQRAGEMAGYRNPANFATAFKRQFGVTPREAREICLSAGDALPV